jgi:hypothetical protein
MVVAIDKRPVFFLLFVAIPLAALRDNPKTLLSAQAGSDLPARGPNGLSGKVKSVIGLCHLFVAVGHAE